MVSLKMALKGLYCSLIIPHNSQSFGIFTIKEWPNSPPGDAYSCNDRVYWSMYGLCSKKWFLDGNYQGQKCHLLLVWAKPQCYFLNFSSQYVPRSNSPNGNVIFSAAFCFAFGMCIQLVAVHRYILCVLWKKKHWEKCSQAWFTTYLILIGELVLWDFSWTKDRYLQWLFADVA